MLHTVSVGDDIVLAEPISSLYFFDSNWHDPPPMCLGDGSFILRRLEECQENSSL
jgi:hypothetical protein